MTQHHHYGEQVVLGAIMTDPEALVVADDTLIRDDFYHPPHQHIYDAIQALAGEGKPFDPTSVVNEMSKRDTLRQVDNGAYLFECTGIVPLASDIRAHADDVAEKGRTRRLQRLTGGAAEQLAQGVADLPAFEENLFARLSEVGTGGTGDGARRLHGVGGLIDGTIDRQDNPDDWSGVVPTGFADLDELTGGGLAPRQVITIAARPAMGKSTLGLDFARGAACRNDRHALFISFEMSLEELEDRLVAAETKTPLHHLRTRNLSHDDYLRIARYRSELAEAPLTVAEPTRATLASVRAELRAAARNRPVEILIVDYVQLMHSTSGKHENRQTEVSELSRGLKMLAREFEIPVVMIAQLNRGPEQRADKKPQLSDLRESGSLEQDSDVVLLLFREDVNDPVSPRAGEADLILAKHRNGPTTNITVAFQGHYSRFVDMAAG